MFERSKPTPLQCLDFSLIQNTGFSVYMKREDRIDPEISGNKWRKLKFNLLEAASIGTNTILTFGGAYSNHIAATAAACRRYGFKAIGIIRGEELSAESNPTLLKAQADGMQLIFVSRSAYQQRNDPQWLESLSKQYRAFIIPEGGSNRLALKGVQELVDEIDVDFTHLICPVGTGGTLAGLTYGLEMGQQALGISCLKGEAYLQAAVADLAKPGTNWSLWHDYHCGGYAKFDEQLIHFINLFYEQTGIPLDPIYTGKMMFGVFDGIKKKKFASGSTLVCIHTGGLQGIPGFNQKHHDLLKLNT